MTKLRKSPFDDVDAGQRERAAESSMSEREAVAKALRDSEARFRDFAGVSSDWFWETGADGEITYMSYRNGPDISSSDTSRLRLSRAAGGNPEDVARDPERWEELWRKLDAHVTFKDFEFPVRDKDGSSRVIRASGKPLFDENGAFAGYRGVGTDVSELVRSRRKLEQYQDRLRQLASEASLSEERERHRIAAELHDGALQNLGMARIQLGTLGSALSHEEHLRLTRDICELVDQSIRETRTLMSELSPPMLYDLGLEPALDWLVERFRERHGVDCDLQVRGDSVTLTHDLNVLLYQAVRELLANIVKHAGASQVHIVLQRRPRTFVVEVSDNGAGFRVEASKVRPSDSGGFGLFSLRERAELLGGSLRIGTKKGARVTITIPIG